MAAARYPISERGWACGRHCRSKPEPDQTRARELRLYRATLPKNITIGTSGWHLSPLLYGYQLNRRTGFEPVLVANKPIDNFVEGNITRKSQGNRWPITGHECQTIVIGW